MTEPVTTIPLPDRFYTLSPNKVTGDRDYASQVYEVLGLNETHAIVQGVIKRGYTSMSMMGYTTTIDIPNQPGLLLISEYDWTECEPDMLAGIVEAGSPLTWFAKAAVS